MPAKKMNKALWKNANPAIAAMLAALAMCAMVFAAAPAGAAELTSGSGSQTFAYAPQALQEEFYEEDHEHELNDAWLGLPVHSASGELAGFVADAYIDGDGNVSELLVDLRASGHNMAVYVKGSLLALSHTEISVKLAITELTSLERDEDYLAMISN